MTATGWLFAVLTRLPPASKFPAFGKFFNNTGGATPPFFDQGWILQLAELAAATFSDRFLAELDVGVASPVNCLRPMLEM